jgi:hypothetical protein
MLYYHSFQETSSCRLEQRTRSTHDERRHDLYRAEKINMVALVYLDLYLDRVLGVDVLTLNGFPARHHPWRAQHVIH